MGQNQRPSLIFGNNKKTDEKIKQIIDTKQITSNKNRAARREILSHNKSLPKGE